MIAECAKDLYDKVQAISALAASAGLAVGGKEGDPGMTKIPLPAAWILAHSGITTLRQDSGLVSAKTTAQMVYVVMLYVAYISQSDLITNQLPLLQTVISAVHGTDSPSGERWAFKDYKLTLVNTDRLGYQIQFMLNSGYL